MNSERKIYSNKAYSFEDAEKFNQEFWQRAGSDAIFSAAWIMLEDFYRFKGLRYEEYADLLRLRKSVQNIKYWPN